MLKRQRVGVDFPQLRATDAREGLAGRAADQDIDGPAWLTEFQLTRQLLRCQCRDVPRLSVLASATVEIEGMRGCSFRIDFEGKLSTVQASAAAIAAAARSAGRADPTKTPLVADTLRGIARQHAAAPEAAPRQATALDYATAIELMRAAAKPQRRGRGRETSAAAEARGRRDAAIVALAFCAGLRRSEIAALVWGDITPTARAGQLRVRVRASKANADGRREDLRLLAGHFARAVEALRAAEEPAAAERVVPLSPHQVNRRVQVLAAALGLEGVSSHSGRRGLASELVRRGASTTAVQAAGGWQSAAMVARYASAVAVEDGAVARLFGEDGTV